MKDTRTTLSFPESYYEELNAVKRKQLLEEAIQAESQNEINDLRLELWNKRYFGRITRKSDTPMDAYIKLWMTLKYAVLNKPGIFGYKPLKREVTKHLKDISLAQTGDLADAIMQQEWYNAACVYLDLCLNDRQYTSTLMKIISLKEEQIREKLAKDIFDVAYRSPIVLGMEEELKLMKRAALRAYHETFPQDRYLDVLIAEFEESE
ncbi:MAG: DUF6553 family protein [Lachnospiraceae bacterium]